MIQAISIFEKILSETVTCNVLYQYLRDVVKPPYDYSDLLRWQWAQSVSALDKLVHDLVRKGMLEIIEGRRIATAKFNTFTIQIDSTLHIISNPTQITSIVEKLIYQKHGFLSFQDPDKISDALSHIWNETNKWNRIAAELGKPENDVKTTLKNISIRRNQIVHEGDYSNALLGRQPIIDTDTQEVVKFIGDLGHAIYALVK